MTLWDLFSEEMKRMVAGLLVATPMIILWCVILARADKPSGGKDNG
jgi:hypothetical protein